MPNALQLSTSTVQLLLGIVLGCAIALAARKARALNNSGAAAAALTGSLVFGLGGFSWAVVLLTFFISSSALSKTFKQRKSGLEEKFSKGHQRDWGQVIANGGFGALMAAAHALFPGEAWPWAAFVGAMAAVNADTWATELGVLGRTPPRLITTGRMVERGTSGAISLLGSLAAAGGAALIGVVALVTASPEMLAAEVFGAALIGGIAGSFFDSLLGATLQAIFWCPQCSKETERHPLHMCGATTIQRRGLRWLENDQVNFAASVVGAAAALLIFGL